MTVQKSINIAIAGLFALLATTTLLLTMNVSAQDETSTLEATQTETPEEENTEDQGTYEYVAQPGDSYSLMARKAVQTFGIESSTNLSGAQIIYVETNLTQVAKSPVLNLGEKVSISRQLVSEWAEKAKSLTEEQQAMWQVYVNNANFSTDSVGEVRE